MERTKFEGRYRIDTARLHGYDYASAGWYHVVVCTKGRVCPFGEVRNGVMGLSAVGCAAYRRCTAIPDHFDRAVTDAFVVMPNHVHAIIGLLPRERDEIGNEIAHVEMGQASVETRHGTSLPANKNQHMSAITPGSGSLGVIVNQYKGAVTRWAHKNGHDDFAWQPRFYDRVIRNERELHATRRYVADNPLKWHLDHNHPDNLL